MACASNLRDLHWARHKYDVRPHGPTGKPQPEQGSEFFLVLQRSSRGVARYEAYICPLSGDAIEPNRTSYRGLARWADPMRDRDPIGADKDGNHGPGKGGNVLTYGGDVFEVPPTNSLWIRARTTTRE